MGDSSTTCAHTLTEFINLPHRLLSTIPKCELNLTFPYNFDIFSYAGVPWNYPTLGIT